MGGKDKKKNTSTAKKIVGDSIWSISGLLLMNVVAQFLVYPIWNKKLGNESHGFILYLLSMMNTYTVTVALACNYARMRASAFGDTFNRTYNRIMVIASAIAVPYTLIVLFVSGIEKSTPIEVILFVVLTVVTMWRYYADVEYRLTLNYKGYFIYYLIISVGYGIGILLFLWTGIWPLALLLGEFAGVGVVFFKGRVLQRG